MNFQTLLVSSEDGIATITLNRPEARNALNGAMCEELRRAAEACAADQRLRVVVLRANGPAFCAGADLKERQGMAAPEVRARRIKGFEAYAALEALPMPVIAVVQGPALGSGAEIAAACDFIIATPEAQCGTVGATQRLPRVLGKRLAKDLMFTGRRLTAEEALAAGLVSRICTSQDLESEIQKITATIAQAEPAALRLAKQCIDRGVERDPPGALALELAAIDEQLASGRWMGKP